MNAVSWRRTSFKWLSSALICSAMGCASAQPTGAQDKPQSHVPEQLFSIAPAEEAALPATFVPGGRRFVRVLGSGGMRMSEWSLGDVSRREFANPLETRPTFLLADPAGKHLVVASDGSAGLSEVARIEIESGRTTYRSSLPNGQKIASITINPRDGSIAALTAGAEATLLLWNAETGRQLFAHSTQAATSLAFTADGRKIVTSGARPERSRGVVEFWNAVTGERERSVELPAIPGFAPVGRLAVSADASMLALQATLLPRNQREGASTSMARLAAASVGGREIAIERFNDADGNPKLEKAFVVLVRAADGAVLHWLLGHDDEITGIEFSSDGTQLLTSSRDLTARIWDTTTGEYVVGFRHEHENATEITPPSYPRFVLATFDVDDWGFMSGSVFTRGSNGAAFGWETPEAKQRRRAREVPVVLARAQAGDAASMYWLAGLYASGAGVEQDPEKAADWLARASNAGYSDAIWFQGAVLLSGELGRQDCAEAAATIARASPPKDANPQIQEAMRSNFEARSRELQDSILAPIGGTSGLQSMSSQIQADLLEAQMLEALTKQEYPGFLARLCAFEFLGHSNRLPVEARRELLYHRALGLRATGKAQAALAALNQYLNEAGNAGANYTQAIQILLPLQEEAK